MIAQNKKEEESRGELGRMGKVMLNLHRRPDTSLAAQVGDPTLVDPKPTNAPDIVKQNTAAVVAASSGASTGTGTVSVETVKPGEGPAPNQPVPRSDTQPGTPGAEPDNSGIPELRPNVAPDASASGTSSGTVPPPPAQINEAAGEPPNQQKAAQTDAGSSSSASDSASASSSDKSESSSKKKKKKGLGKLNPF
jgi:outer membrane protein assembly factor BamD